MLSIVETNWKDHLGDKIMIISAKIHLLRGDFRQYKQSCKIFTKIFEEYNVKISNISFDDAKRIKFCTAEFVTMFDYSNGIIAVKKKALELGFDWEIVKMEVVESNAHLMLPIINNLKYKMESYEK